MFCVFASNKFVIHLVNILAFWSIFPPFFSLLIHQQFTIWIILFKLENAIAHVINRPLIYAFIGVYDFLYSSIIKNIALIFKSILAHIHFISLHLCLSLIILRLEQRWCWFLWNITLFLEIEIKTRVVIESIHLSWFWATVECASNTDICFLAVVIIIHFETWHVVLNLLHVRSNTVTCSIGIHKIFHYQIFLLSGLISFNSTYRCSYNFIAYVSFAWFAIKFSRHLCQIFCIFVLYCFFEFYVWFLKTWYFWFEVWGIVCILRLYKSSITFVSQSSLSR